MRFLDILLSTSALIILIPLLVPIILVLRFTGEGEVFYLQDRVGKGLNNFKVIKFATMLKDSPNIGSGTITAKNDPRILPVGKFLRKTKINELPQLLNVIKGDMSLIGPRPHASRDLVGVADSQLSVIALMRPGLSGMASVVFRDEEKILSNFEDPRPFYDTIIAPYKASLEVWYFENRNISLYVILIIMTLKSVFAPNNQSVFSYFRTLPKPPIELAKYLNVK